MTEAPQLNQIVKAYLRLRTTLQEKEEEFKAATTPLKEELDLLSNALLDTCRELGSDSIRTPAGTVSRRMSVRYWSNNWEAMYGFIKEHDAPFLLEQRVHNGNMKQFLEENPDVMPVGLQQDAKYVVQVRKPSVK